MVSRVARQSSRERSAGSMVALECGFSLFSRKPVKPGFQWFTDQLSALLQWRVPKTLSRMTSLVFQISAMVMASGSSAKNVSAQKLS